MHNQALWQELDNLMEPTIAGRRLDVCGFVLSDPFETFLQNIAESYLNQAWNRLQKALGRFQIKVEDLSWGFCHPGETIILEPSSSSPLDFAGWTSRQLMNLYDEPIYQELNVVLKSGFPAIQCATTWRSLKWRIVPTDYQKALQLLEALCTDDISNWYPSIILKDNQNTQGLYYQIANAISQNNQQLLNELLEKAKTIYTPLGFRIVVRGYASYLENWKITTIQLPQM